MSEQTWRRIASIEALAQEQSQKLAKTRAEAHVMLDRQYDRLEFGQALLLEQFRRDLEGEARH